MKKIHDQRLSSASPSTVSRGNLDDHVNIPDLPLSRGNRGQAAIYRTRKACKRCARLKMKCNGQQPCQRCTKDVRLSSSCSYHHNPRDHSQSDSEFASTSLQVLDKTPSIPLQPNAEDFIAREREPDEIIALASAALAEDMFKNNTSTIMAPIPGAETHDLPSSALDSMMVFDEGDMHPSLFADLLDESKDIFSWLFSGASSGFGVDGMTWSNLSVANTGAINEGVHTSINDSEISRFERRLEDTDHENTVVNSDQHRHEALYSYIEYGTLHHEHSKRNDNVNLVWPNGRSSESTAQELTIVPLSIEEVDADILAFENTYQVVQAQNGIQDRLASLIGVSDLSPVEKDRAREMLENSSILAINVFVQLYFEHYDQLCPIIHRPKFDPNTCHPFLLSAICAIGAM